MKIPAPTAAVTGASGYLGSRICSTLESGGWQVLRLVRSPSTEGRSARYNLAEPVGDEVQRILESSDVLVHAAYDLSLKNRSDIWRVNVGGTRRLLEVARSAGVRRIIVLSSMSAYDGTKQLYGQAKLGIEAMTMAAGGCAIRPGLVYGERPGGMVAALRRLTRLPIVPVLAGDARQYTVHEHDLMTAIEALAEADAVPTGPIGVAHPTPVAFRDLMVAFAAQEGRRCHLVQVPWRPVYWALRVVELLPIGLPFRADSLLGLVRTAHSVPGFEALTGLGVTIRSFSAGFTA